MKHTAAAPARIEVTYPGEGEEVAASRCRLLIDAPAGCVEIAIDSEGWCSCRRGDGHWWFDSSALEPGWHQALIRCEGPRGGAASQLTRRFLVLEES